MVLDQTSFRLTEKFFVASAHLYKKTVSDNDKRRFIFLIKVAKADALSIIVENPSVQRV